MSLPRQHRPPSSTIFFLLLHGLVCARPLEVDSGAGVGFDVTRVISSHIMHQDPPRSPALALAYGVQQARPSLISYIAHLKTLLVTDSASGVTHVYMLLVADSGTGNSQASRRLS